MRKHTFRRALLLFFALVYAGPALALPPPDPRFPEAGAGFQLNYLRSHSAEAGLKGFFPEAVIQPEGSYNLLVIMMNFSDISFASGAQAYFQDLFFGNAESGAYTGRSFVLFYEDMAAGAFRFNRPGETDSSSSLFFCPEAATGTHNYYGSGGTTLAHRGLEFAQEAINCAHNHGYSLSDYDNNADGVAESVLVIHPGLGSEQTGEDSLDIWSHSVELDGFYLDGVGVKYALGPEDSQSYLTIDWSGIGVFAHEYTHNWGIPDLYDPNTEQSRGLGFYDLMSYGLYLDPPAYLSAWPRHKLGWLKEKAADANLCPAELAPVETSGEGYLLYPNRTPGNEYFLVTFNTQYGNDSVLPARGLLIWHVDENKWAGEVYGTPNDNPCYPPSSTDCCDQHYLVALEQADDAYNLEVSGSYSVSSYTHPCPGSSGYYCDAADYWSAGASFSESTAPGSKTYCDGGSAISLDNIKLDPSDSERMLFALSVNPGLNPIYSPAVTSIPLQKAELDELYLYQIGVEGSPPFEYNLVEYPSGVTLGADTGLLTWYPNDTQIGTDHFSVSVENCRGKVTQNWDVKVTYTPPDDDEEKKGGCGCDSLDGAGFLPLGMIGFSWLRRSRRAGRGKY